MLSKRYFMNGIYLIIGGNMGERESNLQKCKSLIINALGDIISESAVYETAAWGKTNQPSFLNQVFFLESNLNPHQILATCLAIESQMGRVRHEKWEARKIDIDILLFNDEVIDEEDLSIPHPHMKNRRFVLKPLADIAPNVVHPVYNKTIMELLENCPDTLEVTRFK